VRSRSRNTQRRADQSPAAPAPGGARAVSGSGPSGTAARRRSRQSAALRRARAFREASSASAHANGPLAEGGRGQWSANVGKPPKAGESTYSNGQHLPPGAARRWVWKGKRITAGLPFKLVKGLGRHGRSGTKPPARRPAPGRRKAAPPRARSPPPRRSCVHRSQSPSGGDLVRRRRVIRQVQLRQADHSTAARSRTGRGREWGHSLPPGLDGRLDAAGCVQLLGHAGDGRGPVPRTVRASERVARLQRKSCQSRSQRGPPLGPARRGGPVSAMVSSGGRDGVPETSSEAAISCSAPNRLAVKTPRPAATSSSTPRCSTATTPPEHGATRTSETRE